MVSGSIPKVANAHSRFQDISCFKSHLSDRIIDGTNDSRAGVVGIQGTGSCCCIFFRRQSCIEFSELLSPCLPCFHQKHREVHPSQHIGKGFPVLPSRISSVKLQFFQNMDCIHISSEFCFRSPFAKMIICDVKINCRNIWDFLCLNRSFETCE